MQMVSEIMTKNPACCTPESSLTEVAKMMIKCDCGEIPVVDNVNDKRIAGVITDRDICCRTLGKDINPLEVDVSAVMTYPAVTVAADSPLDKCIQLMEENQIRRLPVVDDFEKVVGIVSLADIVRQKENLSGEIVREVSKPKAAASLQ